MAFPGTFLLTEARLQQGVSPQLVMQSQILELSADELVERIRTELEENPALEVTEDLPSFTCLPQPRHETTGDLSALDLLSAPYTLADDLRLQLSGVRQLPRVKRQLCEYLIECLDDRGYLESATEEIARRLKVSTEEVEAALQVLQSLEPAGIGGRDLRECLLLQVSRQPRRQVPPQTVAFLKVFLDGSRRQTPEHAARRMGLSERELGAILQFVADHLYLWPAEQFNEGQGTPPAPAVTPDAWIRVCGEHLQVTVAQSWGHSLRVSEAYDRLDRHLRRTMPATEQGGEAACEQVRRARAFIHHLLRREAVLKRVTEVIAASQREFFSRGEQALRPLTRKEVAAAIGVHESTVSRITREKYVQLPDGRLVAFDFFFDGSLSAKAALQALLEEEDPARPLSDSALAHFLQERGYPLARRTVAKYRDQLGVRAAHSRRRSPASQRHLMTVTSQAG